MLEGFGARFDSQKTNSTPSSGIGDRLVWVKIILHFNFTTFTSQTWKNDDFLWFFNLSSMPKILVRVSKHITPDILGGGVRRNSAIRIRFEHFGTVLETSRFWSESPLQQFHHIYLSNMKNSNFRWFFKLSSKPKILIWVSKYITSNISEGFETQFDSQKTVVTLWGDMGNRWARVKIFLYSSFTTFTLQIWK